MTCLVGIEHDGCVTIGGDSAGVSGHALTIRADEKVFRRGEYLFGFTSSFRMGQLLRYALDVPAPKTGNLHAFMATTFIDAVRSTLKAGGYTEIANGRESSGTFFVGIRGRLFAVYDDHQVARASAGYSATGSGGNVAVGSLHSTKNLILDPRERARLALEAAADLTSSVAPPFVIETI